MLFMLFQYGWELVLLKRIIRFGSHTVKYFKMLWMNLLIFYYSNKQLWMFTFSKQWKNCNHVSDIFEAKLSILRVCCFVEMADSCKFKHILQFLWFLGNLGAEFLFTNLGFRKPKKTMVDKLMYIPNQDTQNYPFCRLQLVIETFGHSIK